MNNGPGCSKSDLNPGKFCDLLKRLNPVQIKEALGDDNDARKHLENQTILSKDDKLKSANIQKVLDVVAYLERKIGISPSSNPEGSIGVPAVAKESGLGGEVARQDEDFLSLKKPSITIITI